MTLTLSKGFWSGSPSGGSAFQGENYGYATGDAGGGAQIRRYSFTSDGNQPPANEAAIVSKQYSKTVTKGDITLNCRAKD